MNLEGSGLYSEAYTEKMRQFGIGLSEIENSNIDFFKSKGLDEYGNYDKLSNYLTMRTTPPPVLTIDKDLPANIANEVTHLFRRLFQ